MGRKTGGVGRRTRAVTVWRPGSAVQAKPRGQFDFVKIEIDMGRLLALFPDERKNLGGFSG